MGFVSSSIVLGSPSTHMSNPGNVVNPLAGFGTSIAGDPAVFGGGVEIVRFSQFGPIVQLLPPLFQITTGTFSSDISPMISGGFGANGLFFPAIFPLGVVGMSTGVPFGTEVMRWLPPPTVDDDVSLMIMRRAGGINSLVQVHEGVANSGSAGFRILEIPN